MIHKDSRVRSGVAAVLMALLVALAVAVPLLDRGAGVGPYALAEAQTPSGWVDHDHRICLQHSAMAWLPGVAVGAPSEAQPVAARPFHPSGDRPDVPVRSPHRPRAPPRL